MVPPAPMRAISVVKGWPLFPPRFPVLFCVQLGVAWPVLALGAISPIWIRIVSPSTIMWTSSPAALIGCPAASSARNNVLASNTTRPRLLAPIVVERLKSHSTEPASSFPAPALALVWFIQTRSRHRKKPFLSTCSAFLRALQPHGRSTTVIHLSSKNLFTASASARAVPVRLHRCCRNSRAP